MKNLLSWILSFVIASLIFVVAIGFIPMQTHIAKKVELTYIFVDEDGNKYDLFNDKIHGSADDWAFLFEDDTEDEDVPSNTGYIENKDYVGENTNTNDNDELNNESLENIVNTEVLKENKTIVNKSGQNNEQNNIKNMKPKIEYKDCKTPWNTVVKHNEYVLAYQQRQDVPTICNVQKRTCIDGVLKGSYTQASCREDVEYEYTKVKVISYNTKKPGELIQPPKYAKNDGAVFDNDGKIIKTNNKNTANTIWNNKQKKTPKTREDKKDLTHRNYANCVTPWGEIVGHGQFVKAYKSALGFMNKKCQVELRLCLNGTLQGQAMYKSCEYKDMAYEDYFGNNNTGTRNQNTNVQESEETYGFFHWISRIFR